MCDRQPPPASINNVQIVTVLELQAIALCLHHFHTSCCGSVPEVRQAPPRRRRAMLEPALPPSGRFGTATVFWSQCFDDCSVRVIILY